MGESSSTVTILGMNRSHLLAAAGLAGAAFIGYCIYFDHKRRSAPDYRQKVRERRRQKATAAVSTGRPLPDVRNPNEIQAFFLQEVQLGEELLAEGNMEQGIEHLCNAIALCGQSQQMLQIFQQTLSPAQFTFLTERLPVVRARFSRMYAAQMDAGDDPVISMMPGAPQGLIDPDLE